VQHGEEVIEVPAGAGVMVPRGTPHTYWNPGTSPTRYLLLMTPAILGLIHVMEKRNAATMRAVFEKFDSVPLA
jgi:mannose-6-phosphate isomerase-like protein (cupin superfamily)